MKLTLHTDYALRLLIYLQAQTGSATVGQIAKAYGISVHHLSKVAQRLVRRGWVQASRGRSGGLVLGEQAAALTVGDIVREMETNQRIVECMGPGSTCPIESVCGLKTVIREATQAFLRVLDECRLADLTARPHEVRVLLGIPQGDPTAAG